MQGTDLEWFRRLRAATGHEITAAGGITTVEDIEALTEMNINSAVGMAIYTGRLNLSELARMQPPLKLLHAVTPLNNPTLAKLGQLTTEVLLESLLPGRDACLAARPDGTLLNGHHRIHILRARGIDIHSLPRQIIMNQAD